MVEKRLTFFSGSSLGFGRIFVLLWLWFGRPGGCIGVFGWSLFDLGAFVFSLGVWGVCFVVFEHGFFGVF